MSYKPTPETDSEPYINAINEDGYQVPCVDIEFARKLERERDEAKVAIRALAEHGEAVIQRITKERDEARGKAERYRLEANAMMLQRDEAISKL